MAKKNIRVNNVVKSPAKKLTVLHVGNHRYITSDKVLAAQGVHDVFSLRGKTIGIETYEPGEALIDGSAYEQREDSTLIKQITNLPEKTMNEMVASEAGRAIAQAMMASLGSSFAIPGVNTPATEAAPANIEQQEVIEPAVVNVEEPAEGEQPAAPEVPAPAAVVDEALPE